jgi:hypothetical protein
VSDELDETARARAEQHRLQDRRSQRAALLGLLVCGLLVLGGLLLVYELRSMSSIQDCVMQGRSNCSPGDGTP